MSTKFDKLIVQLDADNAQLRQKLDASNKHLDQFSQRASRSMSVFKGAAVAALGVFSVAKIAGAINSSLEFADSIDKASRAAGVGAQFLQEMRFAADQNGVSMLGLDDSMRRFNRRLGEFINSGGGPAKAAFERLNISVLDINGNVRSTEDVFRDAVSGINTLTTTAQKSAVAAQLFGDDFGPKLVTLLDQGVDGIDRLRKSARDAGAVLTDEMVQSAVDAKDAMGKLNFASDILTNQLINGLSPALKDAANWLTEILKTMGGAPRDIAVMEAELEKLERRLGSMSGASRSRRGGTADAIKGRIRALKDERLSAQLVSTDPAQLKQAGDIIEQQIKALENRINSIPEGKRNSNTAYNRRIGVVSKYELLNQDLQKLVDQRKGILSALNDSNVINSGNKKAPGAGDLAANNKAEAAFFKEVEEAVKQSKKEASELQRILDRLFPDDAKARTFNEELKKLEAANLPADKLAESIRRLKAETTDAGDALEKMGDKGKKEFEELKSVVNGWGRDFADTLLDSERSFGDFADSIVRELGRIAITKATEKQFNAFGDFIGSAVSKIIPGFAHGGTTPGGPIIVGERGPELLSPPKGSRVTPNNALGGTINVYNSYDFTGANPATVQLLRQEARNIRESTIGAIRDMKSRGKLPEFA